MEFQTDNKKINVEFGIESIQVVQFSFDNSAEHQALGVNHSYAFEINSGVLLDNENKFIAIDLSIILFTNTDKADKVCELKIRIVFAVANYEEVVVQLENKVTIPDAFIQHLIALTLSTSRGILFEKLQGSFLSNLILPLFNVTQFQKMEDEL